MFVWSTTHLPNPTTDLSGKLETTTIRTKMESARVRSRKRYTSNWRTISVSWELTDAQFALFEGVFHHKLNDGADFFTMSLPLGNGFADYTVRFVGEYTHSYQDVMHWKVTAQVECDMASVLTLSEVNALLS